MKIYQQYLPEFRRNELELLICCSRIQIDKKIAGSINHLVQQEIDWGYLVRVSLRYRFLPLLYKSLKKTCPEKIPPEIFKKLQNFYLNITIENLFFAGKLFKILKLFDEHDIIAVPFKGPVLAESAYGDIALRQFTDLDILVSPDDALKAGNILMAESYQPEFPLEEDQFLKYINDNNEFAFKMEGKKLKVDLHWRLTQYLSFPLDLHAMQSCLEPANLVGKKLTVIRREEMLIFLCIHGSAHNWEGIAMISCVAECVRSDPDLDWRRIRSIAERLHCRRMLYLGLFLANDLFDVNLPDFIQEEIKTDDKVVKLAGRIFKNIFTEYHLPGDKIIGSKFSSFHFQIREKLTDKLRICLQMAVKPTIVEWQLYPLPARFSFLRYGLRPMRLVMDYFKAERKKRRTIPHVKALRNHPKGRP